MERLKLFFIFTLLLFIGCEPPYLPETPTRINVEAVNYKNSDHKYLLQEVIKLTEEVLNSGEFKREFLELEMTSMNGYTNEEIYNMIVEGVETYKPEANYKWDISIYFYYRNNQSGGMANEEQRIIRFNTKFFERRTIESIVGTFIHEYTHLQGFNHVSSLDITSVPYQVGFLGRDIARKITEKNEEF